VEISCASATASIRRAASGGGGVFNLHRTYPRGFHAIRVRDVERVKAGIAADGVDGVWQHFSHDESRETSGTKSFIKEQPCLNGSESKADESAVPSQCHEETPKDNNKVGSGTDVGLLILGGPTLD
jgi:hypothetical protein